MLRQIRSKAKLSTLGLLISSNLMGAEKKPQATEATITKKVATSKTKHKEQLSTQPARKDRFRRQTVTPESLPTSVRLPKLEKGIMERFVGPHLVKSQEVYRIWDINHDGHPDFVQEVDTKGNVVKCYYDVNFDGKVDKQSC